VVIWSLGAIHQPRDPILAPITASAAGLASSSTPRRRPPTSAFTFTSGHCSQNCLFRTASALHLLNPRERYHTVAFTNRIPKSYRIVHRSPPPRLRIHPWDTRLVPNRGERDCGSRHVRAAARSRACTGDERWKRASKCWNAATQCDAAAAECGSSARRASVRAAVTTEPESNCG
jgi:hypothetical protein